MHAVVTTNIEKSAGGLVSRNLVIPAYTVIYAMSLLIGTGVGTVYAIYRGQEKARKGNEVFCDYFMGLASSI